MISRRARAIGVVALFLVGSCGFWVWRNTRAMPTAPTPIRLRTIIVDEIAQETTLQSVANLARLGDTLYASTNVAMGPARLESYGYLRLYVPSLGRVRKVLAEVDDENREEVLEALLKMFVEATSGFAQADREHRRRYAAARAGGPRYSETDDNRTNYSVYLSKGPTAAYLLAMLNHAEALPEMLGAYRSGRLLPMDQGYLFYSMHLLMLRHSNQGLSPEAAVALAAYHAASTAVPALETESGAAWDAEFDEWDFRTRFAGQGNLVRPTESVEVAYYPRAFVKMELGLPGPSPPVMALDPLVDRIETFVRLAHSHIDWGQDLYLLRDWLAAHQVDDVSVAFDAPYSPQAFGVPNRQPPLRDPQPGWYVVSVNQLTAKHGDYAYFGRFEPTDRIGYSMNVYHVTKDDANRVRRRLGQPELP